MRNAFALTRNVEAFLQGMDAIRGSARRKAEMGLVYGAWGTGKTRTAQKYAAEDENKESVKYVRACEGMSKRALLGAIAGEFGSKIAWGSDAAFHQVVDLLLEPDRCVLVDEVDYLIPTGVVETLRDLYDYTACPIVMIGMKPDLGGILKNRWPWLFDRFGTLIRFQALGAADLADLAEQLCEVALDESAIALIRSRYEGRMRPSLRAMAVAESVARTGRLEVVGAEALAKHLPTDDEAGRGGRR